MCAIDRQATTDRQIEQNAIRREFEHAYWIRICIELLRVDGVDAVSLQSMLFIYSRIRILCIYICCMLYINTRSRYENYIIIYIIYINPIEILDLSFIQSN